MSTSNVRHGHELLAVRSACLSSSTQRTRLFGGVDEPGAQEAAVQYVSHVCVFVSDPDAVEPAECDLWLGKRTLQVQGIVGAARPDFSGLRIDDRAVRPHAVRV